MSGVSTAMCSSFKLECFEAIHDFSTDQFKVALIIGDPAGTYGAATTNYSGLGADEVVGFGYTAGGRNLTTTVLLQGTVATVNFADVSWDPSSIVSLGALIYNSTKGGRAVAVYSFGVIQTDSDGIFSLIMPPSGAATSVVRFA